MRKLLFNSNPLTETAVQSISNAITNFSSLSTIVGEINIPSDFSYLTYLRNLEDEFSKLDSDCTKSLNWLNKNITDFNKTSDEMISNIKNIEVNEIKAETSAINTLY